LEQAEAELRAEAEAEAAEAAKAAKLMTREEFTNLIAGKTPDEVIAAMGAPDSIQRSRKDTDSIWFYNRRTKDPVTGKVDVSVEVIFKNGKVNRVSD
jgi:hypothetical protein